MNWQQMIDKEEIFAWWNGDSGEIPDLEPAIKRSLKNGLAPETTTSSGVAAIGL